MARQQNKAFERVIQLAVKDLQSPEFEKYHADFARRVLADHLAGLSEKPEVRTIVDGREGASEDTVRYGGVIRYEFGSGFAVVRAALDWLKREASKVGTEYADSFFVGVLKQETFKQRKGVGGKQSFETFGVEGRMIPANNFNAASRGLSADSQFIIGNLEPYNRKIDVQLAGLEPIRFNIDDKIFDRCAAAMAAQFKGFDIRRVYTLTFGELGGKKQWILVNGPRAGRPVHSPGLVISRI